MRLFTVYTMHGCKYCVAAKGLLTSEGHSYIEKNIMDDEVAQHEAIIQGFQKMPQVFEGDHHIGGFDKLEVYLKQGVSNGP